MFLSGRIGVAVVAVVAASSCGNGSDGAPAPASTTVVRGACGDVLVEPLDPRSAQHLLPGAPDPGYAGDPPTSGPHLSGRAVSGAQTEALANSVQVAVLEEGGIVVQYRPELPQEVRTGLMALAADKVVVAPNTGLVQPVVATSWRHRLSCRSLDLAALRAFITDREGKGPG